MSASNYGSNIDHDPEPSYYMVYNGFIEPLFVIEILILELKPRLSKRLEG